MLIKNSISGRISVLFICAFLANLAVGRIIYVDDDAPGANDGSSWADACADLRGVMRDEADPGDTIWVAQGVYKPAGRDGDRGQFFELRDGVTLEGGYAGFGEPDPDARDIDVYRTILSGDLNADDVDVTNPWELMDEPTRAENSFHVTQCGYTNESTVLDGFTITGGHANGTRTREENGGGMANGFYGDEDGGGMYIMLGDPTVIRCTFRGNGASGDGGGILCRLSGPSIRNCTISQNFAQFGAGICCLHSWPTIAENVIADNNAIGDGGGIYCANQSSPSITDNEIRSNQAGYHGGGICCMYDSDPNILRNTIAANIAKVDGGGIYCSYSSDANIINNYIVENIAEDDGGGICCMEDLLMFCDNWLGQNP